MFLKHIFLTFLLSGLLINLDAMEHHAEEQPANESAARLQHYEQSPIFREALGKAIAWFYQNIKRKNYGPHVFLITIQVACLDRTLSFQSITNLFRTLLQKCDLRLVDMRDNFGCTALHRACEQGDLDCVQVICGILRSKEEVWELLTAKNVWGQTALHRSVTRGASEYKTRKNRIIKYLLSLVHGHELSVYDFIAIRGDVRKGMGQTALSDAVCLDNRDAVKMMLQAVGGKAYNLLTIHSCCRRFLDAGDIELYQGPTPLMDACSSLEMITLIMNATDGSGNRRLALIMAVDQTGRTALHKCAEWGFCDEMEMILGYVTHEEIKKVVMLMLTNEGKTVLDYAQEYNQRHPESKMGDLVRSFFVQEQEEMVLSDAQMHLIDKM